MKNFNRKQIVAIKLIAADWAVVCSQTAHEHNTTPEAAFADVGLTASFLADELGRLFNGHSFLSTRKSRDFDDREAWNEAVYILAGCFPEMQVELVHHLTDQPKRKAFSLGTIKRALRKLIGASI